MSKLAGFRRFTGKNGKSYCIATVISPATARDNERGCFGTKCEDVFMPDSQYDYLTVADIDKDVKLEFEYSGGRAYLSSLVVEGRKNG